MVYLEDWAILYEVYITSLGGAIKALKASTLRLPVVDGAKVFTSCFLFIFLFFS